METSPATLSFQHSLEKLRTVYPGCTPLELKFWVYSNELIPVVVTSVYVHCRFAVSDLEQFITTGPRNRWLSYSQLRERWAKRTDDPDQAIRAFPQQCDEEYPGLIVAHDLQDRRDHPLEDCGFTLDRVIAYENEYLPTLPGESVAATPVEVPAIPTPPEKNTRQRNEEIKAVIRVAYDLAQPTDRKRGMGGIVRVSRDSEGSGV